MSEFVYLYRSTPEEQREAMGTPEAAQRSIESYLAWLRTLDAKGHLKHPGQPLEPTGKVVRGKTVSDGPYAETKDIVLGFIVIEAADLAEAVRLAESCPIALGGASVEVRPVMKSLLP